MDPNDGKKGHCSTKYSGNFRYVLNKEQTYDTISV